MKCTITKICEWEEKDIVPGLIVVHDAKNFMVIKNDITTIRIEYDFFLMSLDGSYTISAGNGYYKEHLLAKFNELNFQPYQ